MGVATVVGVGMVFLSLTLAANEAGEIVEEETSLGAVPVLHNPPKKHTQR